MGWLVSTKKRTARHDLRVGVQSNLVQSTADRLHLFKLLMASRGTPSTKITVCYRTLLCLMPLTESVRRETTLPGARCAG